MRCLTYAARRLSEMFHPGRQGLGFSARSQQVRDSNIRQAARMVTELAASGPVINLGQGLPDYPAPQVLKDAAKTAIDANFNQYSDTWGYPLLRQAVAQKFATYNGILANPNTEVTITCGASEALHVTAQALIDSGDEVIIFEPFYENYHPDVIIAGGTPRYVRLYAPDYTFDKAELQRAFNRRTKAIMLTTPHNPTGRVFNRDELTMIAQLCQKWNAVAIADEIYEYLVFDGRHHLSIGSLSGMEDRTVTISGLSKTFAVTGWRLGYMHAPAAITSRVRKLHDYITLAAPSPLQMAAVTALQLPDSYYSEMAARYQADRDQLAQALDAAEMRFRKPEGAYYILADASNLGFGESRETWEYLLREFRLVTVAGYCFYRPGMNTSSLRFCFAKKPQTLAAGAAALLAASQARSHKS